MRILVISDTHIPITTQELPNVIAKEAKKSDCCLHAGDFINTEVIDTLSNLTKFYGVYGNMDPISVKNRLPLKKVLNFEEITIGLIHGLGPPSGLIDYIKQQFRQDLEKINIFVFGHSHFPFNKEIENKIYFNPGSPTDRMFAPYRSYGILELEKKIIKRRIVQIE